MYRCHRALMSVWVISLWLLGGYICRAAALPEGADQASEALEMLARVKPVVSSDDKTVVVFFDFGCSHCRDYVPQLLAWADTVPPEVKVRFAPLVSRDFNRVALSHAFYVATRLVGYRGSIPLVEELFASVADRRVLSEAELYRMLGRYGDPRRLEELFLAEAVKADMRQSLRDYAAYKITSVPVVGIGGQYLVGPDDLPPSDAERLGEKFIEVLNGFVSQILLVRP